MDRHKLKGMVFASLFAALTGAVAWFKIPLPFTPVPITLQTLAVLLSGAMLGAYYGALSMIIYLILGSIGLPVFAGGSSGFGALLGPTGGYLLSYPIAAFVIGILTSKVSEKHHSKNILGDMALFVAGVLIAVFSVFVLYFISIPFGVNLKFFPGGISLFNFRSSFAGSMVVDYTIPCILIVAFLVLCLISWKFGIKEKLARSLKYVSSILIAGLLLIISVDSMFSIGFVPFLSELSTTIKITIAILSSTLFLLIVLAIAYSKKIKGFDVNVGFAMLAGTLIIYAMGAVQGKFVTEATWGAVFVGWVLPFIIGDTLKLIAAVYISGSINVKKYMK